MKNKSITYLLMFGVLLIWGLVFYQIFSGLDSGANSGFAAPKKISIPTVMEKEEGVLVLIANYRDPFLGGTSKAIVSSEGKPKAIKQRKVKKQESPMDWSFIDYVGIIQNKETKKKVGMVVISGKEYMVNEKDIIEGVTILKKERDSILVRYVGHKKWVKRSIG